ncbi:MAG: ATP synthase subunit I [Deltaproteobacteria bacterium]|nr:ATP synthase subunit I [Deltaproteobacteria bacterium]
MLIALLTQERAAVLGVALGAGLTCLNFYVLRRLVVKWTADAAAGHGRSAVLMLPKMVGLMAAVALIVLLLPIDVIAFTIGYSIFIVSIVAETIYSGMRPSTDDAPNGHDHG